MEFSDFFSILLMYLGSPEEKNDNKGHSQFFVSIIDWLIREPQTDFEDQKQENDDLNPFSNKEPDTNIRYCTGARKIAKKDAKDVLKRIDDDKEFVQNIDLATPGAKAGIRDALRQHGFEAITNSLGSLCFSIMRAYFEKFAAGKSSVKPIDVKNSQDAENCLRLVQDVNLRCPLCGVDLIHSGDVNAIAGYDVVHIFPDNLDVNARAQFSRIKKAPEKSDALENQIPLCLNCANAYLKDPSLEDYQKLVEEKNRIRVKKRTENDLNQLTLEEKLTKVILLLRNVKPDLGNQSLEYDAHKVEEKITQDISLQGIVNYYVAGYYNKIRRQFSDLEGKDFGFDELAATIKLAYIKLKKENLSQTEIFSRLAQWIRDQESLSDEYMESSRILVAFFVQNCEVFEIETAK